MQEQQVGKYTSGAPTQCRLWVESGHFEHFKCRGLGHLANALSGLHLLARLESRGNHPNRKKLIAGAATGAFMSHASRRSIWDSA
jgi:hypothetical protein